VSQEKKKVREEFRNKVFSRDGHKCVMCFRKDCLLDAHHITPRVEMPNGGYVKENGITLCNVPGGCHEKAESWFSSSRKDEEEFSPINLYRKIKSSFDLAFKASEKLK